MEQVRLIFFFLTCMLTFVPFHALGEADTYEFDPVQGSFTANKTFAKNLNSLVSSLSSLTPKAYGFYSLSSGNSSA